MFCSQCRGMGQAIADRVHTSARVSRWCGVRAGCFSLDLYTDEPVYDAVSSCMLIPVLTAGPWDRQTMSSNDETL
jgi:hypothetical protein